MKILETLTPPNGPSETELREHFKGVIPGDVKLMRPEFTSIWAMEDGTLLWDWKNGYAELNIAEPCASTIEDENKSLRFQLNEVSHALQEKKNLIYEMDDRMSKLEARALTAEKEVEELKERNSLQFDTIRAYQTAEKEVDSDD